MTKPVNTPRSRTSRAGSVARLAGWAGTLFLIGVVLWAEPPRTIPSFQETAEALAALRNSVASRPLKANEQEKLDARLQMLLAPKTVPLQAADPKQDAQMSVPASLPKATLALDARRLAKMGPRSETGEGSPQSGYKGLNRLFRFEEVQGTPAIAVQVESDTPALLPEVAGRLGARFEGQWFPEHSALLVVPISQIRSLIENPSVTRVRAPVLYQPYMDQALPDTHTTAVHNDWKLHGSGAIYASIDTGIDWSHQDFKNPDGTTRILFIWDQTATGTPPAGYTYGAEWTAGQINAGACTEQDNDASTWGHGTSTTGVAAGNGSSTGGTYDGQADQADIILVKSDLSDAHIEDGLRYIKDKAASLGKPVSINMSFGSDWGPHDGGDDLSYWIDNNLGVSDSSAGIALSAAAGNATGNLMHADGNICAMTTPSGSNQTDATNITAYSYDWNGNGYAGQPMNMEFYFPTSANIELRAWIPVDYYASWTYFSTGWVAISSANSGYYSISRKSWRDSFVGDPTTAGSSSTFGVYLGLENPMTDYHNGNLQYAFVAYDYATTAESAYGGDLYYVPPGWSGPMPIIVQFRQNGGTASGAHVDGYMTNWTYGYFATATEDCTNRYLGGDDAKMINGPAAAHDVIAVGAHVTKTSWVDQNGTPQSSSETLGALASYSSHGPLRGISEGNAVVNDQKPNLTAPGEVVVTSLSSQLGAGWYTGSPQSQYIVQETPSRQHIAESGTSFSCAQVSGAAAILLGADPALTLGQIRGDLQAGARSDGFTGTTPNDFWGYGKLTLDSSLAFFANLIRRGTVASSLPPLGAALGNTYTDAGAASGPDLFFYNVDGAGDTLRVARSGNDVVLTW